MGGQYGHRRSAHKFFLIFNGKFISNSAPNGTGGAIVLTAVVLAESAR